MIKEIRHLRESLYHSLIDKVLNHLGLSKKLWIALFLLISSNCAIAQQSTSLDIDRCFEMAKQNYPLIKQYSLIEKTKEYSIANANKRYLPQLHIAGQATYQSDIPQIPIKLPNAQIPTIDKDQYRLYGEISQPITNLFTVKKQKASIDINSQIAVQKTEVELYQLKERIANLYFGILMMDAQLKQVELIKKDLQYGIEKTHIAIQNGVALKSAMDGLKAELLKVNQHSIELEATRKGYADMLSLFIGVTINESTIFETPAKQTLTNTIFRPEQKLFELQIKSLDVQKKLLTTRNLPYVSLFLQGGLGRPALNFLNPDLDFYYIAGIRLSWNLTNFYTYKKEKEILSLNQDIINIKQETFLFNTQLKLKQQNAEIDKIKELIKTDKEIVNLQENIKNTTLHQLSYGTATTNDYLTAINAENKAKQNLILHNIQLLMSQYNTQITKGY